jgi:TatD DNase family protein
MLIDTHTHVPDLSGVDKIIFSAASPDGAGGEYGASAVLAAARENPGIFCTIGIHPDYAGAAPGYEAMLADDKVAGIGEIGLDYRGGGADRAGQLELFGAQLEIARRANLPVAVHSRDAEEDTAALLKNLPAAGVMHCFTGTYDFARLMLDRGFFISASGIITFKNADAVRETFARIPSDRLVAETDSPFCAPAPFRGQKCRPAMMLETVKMLAAIKGAAPIEMEEILWNNSHELYGKLKWRGK